MAADYTRLIHRWFDEVWSAGRLEVVDELVAEGYVTHGLIGERGQEVSSREAFKDFVRRVRAEFTDISITVADVLEDGHRTAVRCTVTGTHRASGRAVNLTGISLVRWKDGKIAEVWNNFDFAKIQQLLD